MKLTSYSIILIFQIVGCLVKFYSLLSDLIILQLSSMGVFCLQDFPILALPSNISEVGVNSGMGHCLMPSGTLAPLISSTSQSSQSNILFLVLLLLFLFVLEVDFLLSSLLAKVHPIEIINIIVMQIQISQTIKNQMAKLQDIMLIDLRRRIGQETYQLQNWINANTVKKEEPRQKSPSKMISRSNSKQKIYMTLSNPIGQAQKVRTSIFYRTASQSKLPVTPQKCQQRVIIDDLHINKTNWANLISVNTDRSIDDNCENKKSKGRTINKLANLLK